MLSLALRLKLCSFKIETFTMKKKKKKKKKKDDPLSFVWNAVYLFVVCIQFVSTKLFN